MKFCIDKKNYINNAASDISDGKIIIYPTDTLYGFGVDATNTAAIKELNIIKKREQPYSIIVNSFSMLTRYCNIDKQLEKFATKIFPGPFTLILNKTKNSSLSKLVTLNLNTIGIRIPDSKFILDVVKYIDKPIITTSVNSHKEKSLNSTMSIEKRYSEFNLYYSSKSKDSLGSTIIDCTVNPYKILRHGDGIL
tara:strand:+ start:9961 stop:10542 length:582 start_codon:yes stop_codon:yes gene_type:complete